MKKIEATVTIDASADKVWDAIADFSGVSKWAPGITKSYSLSDSNGGPGAARHCDIAGFGGIDEVVTAWEDGKFFQYEVTAVGPVGPSKSLWSVTPEGSKTKVYANLEYTMRFGPLGAFLHAVMVKRKMQDSMKKALAGLKHYIETGEPVDQRTRLPELVAVA